MEVFKLFATMSLQDLISKPLMKVQTALKGTAEKAALLNAKAMELGKAMIPVIAVAGAIATGFGFAIKTAADFESQMAKVGAVSRASVSEMAQLEKAARDLGASTVFSASQVAQAEEYLAMAGFSVSQNIAALPSVLNLAAAASLDLGRSADISSDILSAFGLQAEEMTRVADTLVSVFTTANTNLEMLGDSMKYVAPIAKKTGLSLEETAAMAGLLGNIGIKGSQAGTVLRSMLGRLGAASGETAEMLSSLGVATKDAAGNLRSPIAILGNMAGAMENMGSATQIAMLKTIFGEEAISGVSALIESEGIGAISKYVQQIQNMGGAAEQVAKRQGMTLTGSIKGLSSAWESATITIGKLFIPAVTRITKAVTVVTQTFDFLAKSPIGTFIIKLTAGLSLGVLAFGGLIAAVVAVTAALPAVTTALGLIGGAAASIASPLLLIVGLVAVFTFVWRKNLGGIADFTKSVFSRVSLVVQGVATVFRTLQEGVGELKGELAENIQAEGLVGLVTSIGKALYRVYSFASGFFSVFKTAFIEIAGDLKPIGNLILTIFTPLFKLAGLLVQLIGLFGFAGNAVSANKWATFGKVIATVVTVPLRILAVVIGLIARLLNALATEFISAGEYVWSLYKGLTEGLLELFSSLKETFAQGIKSIFGIDLFESGKKLVETFTGGIMSVISKPKEMLEAGLDKLRNLLPFSDAKEGPLSSLTLSGTRLMTTIGEGISVGAASLYNTAEKAFAGIPSPEITPDIQSVSQPPLPELSPVPGTFSKDSGAETKQEQSTKGLHITISKLVLPNVQSADDFVSELEQIALQGGF